MSPERSGTVSAARLRLGISLGSTGLLGLVGLVLWLLSFPSDGRLLPAWLDATVSYEGFPTIVAVTLISGILLLFVDDRFMRRIGLLGIAYGSALVVLLLLFAVRILTYDNAFGVMVLLGAIVQPFVDLVVAGVALAAAAALLRRGAGSNNVRTGVLTTRRLIYAVLGAAALYFAVVVFVVAGR